MSAVVIDPAKKCVPVVTGQDIKDGPARIIYSGAGGDIELMNPNGSTYTLTAFPAGSYTAPALVKQVVSGPAGMIAYL